MSHKFKIIKYPKNTNRQSCLLIDLENEDKPIYIYSAYLPASGKYYFALQEGENEKSNNWIQNPEKIINSEILNFVKNYLLQNLA